MKKLPFINRAHEKFLAKRIEPEKMLPYVTSIKFEELTEAKETIVGKPILCSKCNAALTDPARVQTDPKIGYYFNCEFCNTLNIVDPKDLPENPIIDVDFIIKQRPDTQDVTKLKITGDNISSIIDISGSMGDGKLEAVKRSLIETVRDLKVNSPGSHFSLITFESEVRLLSYKGKEILKLSGDMLHSKNDIIKQFEKVKIDFVPISDTANSWIDMIGKLTPMDMTALGPALLGGVTLLKRTGSGGRLILLTDGMANQGIGNLEAATSTGKQFYNEMSDFCLKSNIIVEVVGVQSQEGASELGLDVLGKLADKTGGNIFFVTRDELQSAFEKMRSIDYLAKDVSVNVITSTKNIKLSKVTGVPSPSMTGPINIGAVTKDREIFYELEAVKDLKEEDVPIQTQIQYKDKEGNLHLRIVNEKLKTTKDDKEYKKGYNVNLAATMKVQEAGDYYYDSDVAKAKESLKSFQTNIKNLAKSGGLPQAAPSIAQLGEEIQNIDDMEEKAKSYKGAKSFRASAAQELKRKKSI